MIQCSWLDVNIQEQVFKEEPTIWHVFSASEGSSSQLQGMYIFIYHWHGHAEMTWRRTQSNAKRRIVEIEMIFFFLLCVIPRASFHWDVIRNQSLVPVSACLLDSKQQWRRLESRDYLNFSTRFRNSAMPDGTTLRQQQRADLFSKAASMFVAWNCFMQLSTSSMFSRSCTGVSWKPRCHTNMNTVSDYFSTCKAGWIFWFLLLPFTFWSNSSI